MKNRKVKTTIEQSIVGRQFKGEGKILEFQVPTRSRTENFLHEL